MWFDRTYETHEGEDLLRAAAQGDDDAAQIFQKRTIPGIHASAAKSALARTVKEVQEVEDPGWVFHRLHWGLVDELKRTRIKHLKQNPQDENSPEWYYRHAQGFRFLDLPIELRREVYDELMPTPNYFGCETRPEKNFGEWQANLTRSIPNITLANRQISTEFLDTLYKRCKFKGYIDWGGFQPFGWFGKTYDYHESGSFYRSFNVKGRTYWLSSPPFEVVRGGYDWPVLESLHPTVANIRHWNLYISRNRCPAKFRAIKQLVEMFCCIVQVSGIVESIIVDVSETGYTDYDDERRCAYNIEMGQYSHAREFDGEDANILPACDDSSGPYQEGHYKPYNQHQDCGRFECFWTPMRSKKSKLREEDKLTDLEYVLRPFEVLRGLKHVKVKVDDRLRKEHRTQSYILGLEAMMMSDVDEDLRRSQQWFELIEAARKSLYLR